TIVRNHQLDIARATGLDHPMGLIEPRGQRLFTPNRTQLATLEQFVQDGGMRISRGADARDFRPMAFDQFADVADNRNLRAASGKSARIGGRRLSRRAQLEPLGEMEIGASMAPDRCSTWFLVKPRPGLSKADDHGAKLSRVICHGVPLSL